MFRVAIPGRRPLAAFLLASAVLYGCDGSTSTIMDPPPPAFTLMVIPEALVLAHGTTVMTAIRAVRSGGLTSELTYTVSTSSPGLTSTLAATDVPDSATLTVSAADALLPGDYTVTLDASAAGALPQEATITVTVIEGPGTIPDIGFVATGGHSCAIATNGAAYCWGFNASGQLGNNEMSLENPVPVTVAGGIAFERISVAKLRAVSCGLSTQGAAYCWGDNSGGEGGDGGATFSILSPSPVLAGQTFSDIAAGDGHACAVATDGTAWCWGRSQFGALGDGTTETRFSPVVAAGGMKFESIVAGTDFTCALTPAGRAWCWGLGRDGQLGNGLATNSLVPVEVSGGLTFRSLAASGQSVCGLTTDGAAFCWGSNLFGTLGDGTGYLVDGTFQRPSPVAVVGGHTFEMLAAGFETMCGVASSGLGYCWGYNNGVVGDGTTVHRAVPTLVAGGLTWRSISPGTGFACGVTTADAVFCWGVNSTGELGDGTLTPHLLPMPVHWP